jgi:hypothetical protein
VRDVMDGMMDNMDILRAGIVPHAADDDMGAHGKWEFSNNKWDC